jgi:hypothetical protein
MEWNGIYSYIVSGVRVVVDTAKEGSSGVLADILAEKMTSSRMLVKERGNIVDKAGNKDEWSGLGLFLDCK